MVPGKEHSREEGKNTLHCLHKGPPSPDPTTTWLHPSGALHFTFSISLWVLKKLKRRKNKNLPPYSEHPSPPTQTERNREHGTPWVQEKNREQKKRLVWSLVSWWGSPGPPLPIIPTPDRLLINWGSNGWGRSGWEGVCAKNNQTWNLDTDDLESITQHQNLYKHVKKMRHWRKVS